MQWLIEWLIRFFLDYRKPTKVIADTLSQQIELINIVDSLMKNQAACLGVRDSQWCDRRVTIKIIAKSIILKLVRNEWKDATE